jgi:hypothetical protein
MWACRKNQRDVVQVLVVANASLDNTNQVRSGQVRLH